MPGTQGSQIKISYKPCPQAPGSIPSKGGDTASDWSNEVQRELVREEGKLEGCEELANGRARQKGMFKRKEA